MSDPTSLDVGSPDFWMQNCPVSATFLPSDDTLRRGLLLKQPQSSAKPVAAHIVRTVRGFELFELSEGRWHHSGHPAVPTYQDLLDAFCDGVAWFDDAFIILMGFKP